MPALFISYSRVDSGFAVKLVRDLKARGIAAWIDQIDIAPGMNWDVEIERALGDAETVLVILSQHSAGSENVKNEISLALELKKQIVPIVVSKSTVPLIITRVQREDFTGDYASAFSKLMLRLSRASRTSVLAALSEAEMQQLSTAAAARQVSVVEEAAALASFARHDSLNPATVATPRTSLPYSPRLVFGGAAVALLLAAGAGALLASRGDHRNSVSASTPTQESTPAPAPASASAPAPASASASASAPPVLASAPPPAPTGLAAGKSLRPSRLAVP